MPGKPECKVSDRIAFRREQEGESVTVFGTIVGLPHEEADGMVRVYWDWEGKETLAALDDIVGSPLPRFYVGDRVVCYRCLGANLCGYIVTAAAEPQVYNGPVRAIHPYLYAFYDVLFDGNNAPQLVKAEDIQLSAVQELINAYRNTERVEVRGGVESPDS